MSSIEPDIFINVIPKMIALLTPIIETTTKHNTLDPTSPGEIGVLAGHILKSIDITKIRDMMNDVELGTKHL